MLNQQPSNQQGQPMGQPAHQPMHQGMPMHTQQPGIENKSRRRMPWMLLTIVAIVVVCVLGFLFRYKLGFATQPTGAKLSGYQAVFLTNGQVYFGKMTGAEDQYVTLRDIFYLQVNSTTQDLQSGQNASPQDQTSSDQNPQLSLVKLGNELHGPDDIMRINRDQVLFYEDLKADGRVAQAIVQYQQNPNAANAAGATGTAPATSTTGTAPAVGSTAPAPTTPAK